MKPVSKDLVKLCKSENDLEGFASELRYQDSVYCTGKREGGGCIEIDSWDEFSFLDIINALPDDDLAAQKFELLMKSIVVLDLLKTATSTLNSATDKVRGAISNAFAKGNSKITGALLENESVGRLVLNSKLIHSGIAEGFRKANPDNTKMLCSSRYIIAITSPYDSAPVKKRSTTVLDGIVEAFQVGGTKNTEVLLEFYKTVLTVYSAPIKEEDFYFTEGIRSGLIEGSFDKARSIIAQSIDQIENGVLAGALSSAISHAAKSEKRDDQEKLRLYRETPAILKLLLSGNGTFPLLSERRRLSPEAEDIILAEQTLEPQPAKKARKANDTVAIT